MAKKKSSKNPIRAEATAKAEFAIKAIYQRKRTTTEVVPVDVTRAKAGAWLDLISPITEWAGLKGDQIRSKRELLRIQREDVLEKIALRANAQLRESTQEIRSIPIKFLVPFLEKASLEDENSELVEKWATLLASAAVDFNPHMVRFCSILSEIGADEVKFLDQLCRGSRSRKRFLNAIEDAPMMFSLGELRGDIDARIDTSKSLEENVERIVEGQEMPGGLLLVLGVDDRVTGAYVDSAHELDDRKWEASISLLQSLGLVENHILVSGEVKNFSWYAETVSLTSFGVAFVSACDPEISKALKYQ